MTPLTLSYLSLAFVFAFTPGATTAVVIRHTLEGGVRRGMTASAGAMTASAMQALLAVAGISTLLVAWPDGLRALGLAGALFLAWLGLKSLRAAFTAAPAHPRTLAPAHPDAPAHPTSPFRDGFSINILNPSVTSFYVGVTPTFVPHGSSWRALALLYVLHISVAISCHLFWATLFSRARTFFAAERPRRWLDAIVGLILLALAIRIAAH